MFEYDVVESLTVWELADPIVCVVSVVISSTPGGRVSIVHVATAVKSGWTDKDWAKNLVVQPQRKLFIFTE